MKRVAIAILLWQMFWLNIFLPGHTRGAYSLMPGGDSCCAPAVPEEPSCCAKDPAKKQPTQDEQRRCAACYYAKGYTVATVFIIDLRLTGHVIDHVQPVTAQVVPLAFDFPYYPAGPPIL